MYAYTISKGRPTSKLHSSGNDLVAQHWWDFDGVYELMVSSFVVKAISVTDHGGPSGCETPRLTQTVGLQMAVRSALRAGRPLLPERSLGLISIRGWVDPQGHGAAGRVRSIEKSSDLIGNRTRDIPACSIMPQPVTWMLNIVSSCMRRPVSVTYTLLNLTEFEMNNKSELHLPITKRRFVDFSTIFSLCISDLKM
jgi:hypothetical protein